MHLTKSTTPKTLQINLQTEGTNNGVGESSFRVLYYGTASAGSVPFMWESQPGTPKHALTESSLPPLTPPPSYHQFTQKYNSTMQMINHSPKSSGSGFLRYIFLSSSSRKRNLKAASPSSFSSRSVSSCSSYSSSSQSTPMRKTDGWRSRSVVKFGSEEDRGEEEHASGGGSPTSTLCLGGGFKKSYRIKKLKEAMMLFVGHGKA